MVLKFQKNFFRPTLLHCPWNNTTGSLNKLQESKKVIKLALTPHFGRSTQYGFVRLPSIPERFYWYMVYISVGCRPWAGHEGNVYLQLNGKLSSKLSKLKMKSSYGCNFNIKN